MTEISHWLTGVIDLAPPWAVYLTVIIVVYLEVAVLVCGLILPSEATLIAAGVAAAIGQPNIVVLAVCASLAALSGDLTGYYLGERTGPRIMQSWAGRKFGEDHWLKAEDRVRENVWVAVPIGRWIGYVRTLVPVAAGLSRVELRTYALATFVGGTTWSASVLVLAYVLGATAGVELIGILVIVLVAVGVGTVVLRALGRWRLHRQEEKASAQSDSAA
ncbi:DedA family protein [Gordonia iterans]|uniref:DedA family protein n=1 Tax=Gordonia iterans TaxID=1004901 RepID=A0A2S0KBV6_9ACTN|nr:DedA family protein [Gordonia iterans]AVL99145.1 DedA family protein [Gordonia iterans]